MPNIKSAKKRVLVAEACRQRNASTKSYMKTSIKKFEQAVAGGNQNEIQTTLKEAVSTLDKTAQKGVIHKNTAARYKAQLQRIANN